MARNAVPFQEGSNGLVFNPPVWRHTLILSQRSDGSAAWQMGPRTHYGKDLRFFYETARLFVNDQLAGLLCIGQCNVQEPTALNHRWIAGS